MLTDAPVFEYDWVKENESEYHSIGTSAQWWKEHFPCIVHGSEETVYSLEESKIGILTLKGLQKEVLERRKENQELKKRVSELEERLKAIEDFINR